jgi:hypothetical protein
MSPFRLQRLQGQALLSLKAAVPPPCDAGCFLRFGHTQGGGSRCFYNALDGGISADFITF